MICLTLISVWWRSYIVSQAGSFHRSGDSQLLSLLQLSPLFQLQPQPFSHQMSSRYLNWFQDPGHALYAPKFSGKSDFICVKCKKVLGTAASLGTHIDSFHKYRNYTCIYCQYSCQYKDQYTYKREITKHMKQHPHWVAHPEFRCAFCVQCLHNKDGLSQPIKSCKHNPHKQTGYFMCRKPGCGSVFSLEKKRNYHERHLCDLLKKNIGRGRGQSQ